MKHRLFIMAAGLIVTMTMQAQKQKTFVVDNNLSPTEEDYRYLSNGTQIANSMLYSEDIPKDAYGIIATSFADARNMRAFGKDAFYRCVVKAYATHQSLVLSPDMIWLLISQGFARYVNTHAEELRPMLVSHEGKMDLVVESTEDLLSGKADWNALMAGFTSQIDKYTKDDIAKTITADFTTTTPVERVASQITLMESVKAYFEYIVYYIKCGIPTITIQGTPQDWQKVLEKTKRLEAYGLGKWTKSLEPILKEFIKAAEGQPNRQFWQGMVKKRRVDELKGGGCSPDKPTEVDGWILKFFPDEDGNTSDHVAHFDEMPSERVRVSFKYRVIDPVQGGVSSETPMELWAGFIGAEADSLTCTLTPKIGWLVRVAESDDDVLKKMQDADEVMGIELRVKEVPQVLSKLKHINSLNLQFTDDVVLPEWLDDITIDHFSISGKMTKDEKEYIQSRFPNAHISNY